MRPTHRPESRAPHTALVPGLPDRLHPDGLPRTRTTRTTQTICTSCTPRSTGLALLLAAAFAGGALAQTTALPSNALPVLRDGGARINATVTAPAAGSNTMTIDQSASRALVEWSSFNIGSAATVSVKQPASSSILVNHVVSGTVSTAAASRIEGTLSANGRVFILDPNGVVFARGASVNVGGLLAAAMAMDSSNEAFIAGSPLLLVRSAAQGNVIVEGALGSVPAASITATGGSSAGDVVLLGVGNTTLGGSVNAPGGRVVIAAAGGAEIPVGDSGFLRLKLTPATNDLDPRLEATYVDPAVVGEAGSLVSAEGGQVRIEAAGERPSNSTTTAVNWSGSLDTANAAGQVAAGSSIEIRGDTWAGAGVLLQTPLTTATALPNNRIRASTIRIDGRAEVGIGVGLARVDLSGDDIQVRGVSAPSSSGAVVQQTNPVGVVLSNVDVTLGQTGSLLVAGRGELPISSEGIGTADGLRLDGLFVNTPVGGGRRVTLAGESVNASNGAGIVTSTFGGGSMFQLSAGEGDSGAEVLIGADALSEGAALVSTASSQVALLAATNVTPQAVTTRGSGPASPFILTTGQVNLRPLGVDASGQVVEHPTTPIQLGSTGTTPTTPFFVPADWVADFNADSIGNIAASSLVIGSALHQGAITVGPGVLGGDTLPLTLQNQGAGSAGVNVAGSDGQVRNLAIASAGAVATTAPTSVDQLFLLGAGSNTADLSTEGNAIGTLSYAQFQSVILPAGIRNQAGSASGFDAGGSRFTRMAIAPGLPVIDGPPPLVELAQRFFGGGGSGPGVVSTSVAAEATSSEAYGRNLSSPSMCMAPVLAAREREVGDKLDLLGIEWGRVRQRPQVSGCMAVGSTSNCAGF